jgi:hypothetical protein
LLDDSLQTKKPDLAERRSDFNIEYEAEEKFARRSANKQRKREILCLNNVTFKTPLGVCTSHRRALSEQGKIKGRRHKRDPAGDGSFNEPSFVIRAEAWKHFSGRFNYFSSSSNVSCVSTSGFPLNLFDLPRAACSLVRVIKVKLRGGKSVPIIIAASLEAITRKTSLKCLHISTGKCFLALDALCMRRQFMFSRIL